MGKNKITKFAEMETFDRVIQVPYYKIADSDFNLKGKWNKDFFKNDNPIVLELGCGKGEYTVGLARRFPSVNFIGIDIKGARMWKGAKEIHLQGIKNAGLLRTNIELLPHLFASDEVSELWLTFPDPQMKKTRKRLTSCRFIELYSKFLKQGGVIHLKTDSNFLFQYTASIARINGFEIMSSDTDLHSYTVMDEVLGIKTFYEEQWISRGIRIKYLKFIPHCRNLREPETEPEHDSYRSFGRNQRSMKGGLKSERYN